MVLRMDEVLYWFETLSGKRPADTIFAINFRWIGLGRDVEPWEIDSMSLVYIGRMSRAEFEKHIRKDGDALSGTNGSKNTRC